MTLFSTKHRAYYDKTQHDLFNGSRRLCHQFMSGTSPFFEDNNCGLSALYPVAYAAQAMHNLLKIAEGVLIVIPGLLIEPKTSPLVLKGIGIELGALVLNCLTTAVSLLTFVTRSLTTIFRGYSSNTIYDNFLSNKNPNDRRILCDAETEAEFREKELKEDAFSCFGGV